MIMNSILSAIKMPSEDVQMLGLQALDETPFIGYDHLGSYMQEIGNETMALLSTDKYELVIEALKFWIDLSKKEVARLGKNEVIHYLPTCGKSLI